MNDLIFFGRIIETISTSVASSVFSMSVALISIIVYGRPPLSECRPFGNALPVFQDEVI